MENQSSETLVKNLITTLASEITALEKQEADISFKIKAKKAQLRKYQKAHDDSTSETTLAKEAPNKV